MHVPELVIFGDCDGVLVDSKRIAVQHGDEAQYEGGGCRTAMLPS
jgi:beta-phosphoglucomutase-like phosphatase (HAD superfamily)